jgi:hypothetical protein
MLGYRKIDDPIKKRQERRKGNTMDKENIFGHGDRMDDWL